MTLREAFKKKFLTNVTIEEGGSRPPFITIFKVVFKIHFRPF